MKINKLLLSATLIASIFAGAQAKGVNPVLSMLNTNEKVFVVERESNSLAVIEKGMTKGHIEGMHNMNHGVVKFDGKDGYVISRDGFVIKFATFKMIPSFFTGIKNLISLIIVSG